MKRNKILCGLVLAALSLGAAGAVSASGYKATYPTVVDNINSSARGSLGSTRNVGDGGSYIGCTARRYTDGRVIGQCMAGASSGVKSCTTDDPDMIEQIRSVKGDSYLEFTWSGGTCTSLHVANWSHFEPKAL